MLSLPSSVELSCASTLKSCVSLSYFVAVCALQFAEGLPSGLLACSFCSTDGCSSKFPSSASGVSTRVLIAFGTPSKLEGLSKSLLRQPSGSMCRGTEILQYGSNPFRLQQGVWCLAIAQAQPFGRTPEVIEPENMTRRGHEWLSPQLVHERHPVAQVCPPSPCKICLLTLDAVQWARVGRQAAMDRVREHQTALSAAVGVTVAAAGAYYVWRNRDRTPQAGPYSADSLPTGAFDALIVGAGPSGSTAAYYLARAGAKVRASSPITLSLTSRTPQILTTGFTK